MRELAAVVPDKVHDFMPMLADLSRLSTFQHAFNLHETLWRSLPAIGKGLGKPKFKGYLEDFLGPLFLDLSCGHNLAEVAAGRCIAFLRDFLGPSILAGRLSPAQAALMSNNPNVPPPCR